MSATAFPALARLLAPLSADEFVADYWEKKTVHVRARPGHSAPPISLAELDAILTERPHQHPALSLVDAANPIEAESYSDAEGWVDMREAIVRYGRGATIIVNRVDEHAPRVRALCGDLESELGMGVQANLYLTPRNAQGFAAHFDSHDVIIVQCQGAKDWRFYDSPRGLPMRGERFNKQETPPGAITETLRLEEGDVLYVPRGLIHDAVAVDGASSVHVTLGLHAVRWSEVLLEAIAQASLDDPALREGLPPGALVRGDRDEALNAALSARLEAIRARVSWQSVASRVESQFFTQRKRDLRGMLLDASEPIGEAMQFAFRRGVIIDLDVNDDHCLLHIDGRSSRWPAHAAETLEAALAQRTFGLDDLGDSLDEAGKLTLVRRLITEGALKVSREALS
ncbi:MAG: hypothetical protein JNK72_15440 [Myxococcales bacterium]|nr:hypothetical protein [Myxococcales bacterium]